MKIERLWEELENDSTFTTGILLRRYSGEILPDVFIALQAPEKFRCVAASVNSSIKINISSLANLRDIQVEVMPDPQRSDRNMIFFKLLSNDHKDIFSILCEDLMLSITKIDNDNRLIAELLNRFEKWKSLFDKTTLQGLTSEEQRGLYSELYLLRKFLWSGIWPFQNIIHSWVGPDRQIKDFQYADWAIEVKCTSGNNHQKAHINSERQLDTSNLQYLILYHLSLDGKQLSGETLNQIVQSVFNTLQSDFTLLNRFRNKLLEAAYFDWQSSFYEDTGYALRSESFYEVRDDFPRIEEKDIRSGVGDVKYSIILSQHAEYLRTEEQVLSRIHFR